MGERPKVYYSNGAFLIFSTNDALQLRRCRVVGHSSPGKGETRPHCLSPYAAYIVAKNELATFKQLVVRQRISVEENKEKFKLRMDCIIDEQKKLLTTGRLAELRRRNVTPTPRTLGEFHSSRVRIPVGDTPDPELTSFDERPMDCDEVVGIVERLSKQGLQYVYNDLHKRGFYVTSGIKFGCDFLAYLDEPVRYHARYAIRLVQGNSMGLVSLEKLNFCEVNSLQRLVHSANKVLLFVIVDLAKDPRDSPELHYWTLGERIYLTPDSKDGIFKLIEPLPGCSSETPSASSNKASKIS